MRTARWTWREVIGWLLALALVIFIGRMFWTSVRQLHDQVREVAREIQDPDDVERLSSTADRQIEERRQPLE